MGSLLEEKNVTKIFGGGLFSKEEELIAVNDISLNLEVENPKIIAIAGESGSGKTTLARLLLGLIDPNEGSVEYLGKSIDYKPTLNEVNNYDRYKVKEIIKYMAYADYKSILNVYFRRLLPLYVFLCFILSFFLRSKGLYGLKLINFNSKKK